MRFGRDCGSGRIATRVHWRRRSPAYSPLAIFAPGRPSASASRLATARSRLLALIDYCRSNLKCFGSLMSVLDDPVVGRERTEKELVGRGVAPGLGMGNAWVVGDVLKGADATDAIGQGDVERELERLKRCFEETLAELEQSSQRIEFEFDAALA